MKDVLVLFIVFVLSLPALFFILPAEEVKADDAIFSGNNLYVDDSGGSTYTSIYSAMQDASSGDTIYVAPGTYYTAFTIGKSDVSMIGNASQGDVRIVGDVEFIPFGLRQCKNFSIAGFTFGGQGHVINLDECENISFMLCKMESSSYAMGLLEIADSNGISVGWCSFTSTYRDAYAFDIDTSNNFRAAAISVGLSGAGSGVLEAVNSNDAVMDTVKGTYLGSIVNAQGSTVTTVDTVVPDGNVSIDGTSSLEVKWSRRVVVKEEDDISRLGDVEMELLIAGSPAYYTPHYGGTDGVSNAQGIFPDLPPLVQKIFDGSSTPTFITNTMKFYHDGLDVPREVDLGEVAADNNNEIHVLFPDMRAPEPPANVHASTVDHDTIDVRFDASPSTDVDHYEIWYNSNTGWEEVLNTTETGEYQFNYLEPGKLHQFRVKAVDDAMISSIWVNVENTTGPPVEGTLRGRAVYAGGPLNGTAVHNATVLLYNDHSNGTWGSSTDPTGRFELINVDFEDDFHLFIGPPNATEHGSTTNGYVNTTFDLDFHEDMDLNLSVAYYEYMPPVIGALSGRITYLDGPMTGENATNATVLMFNSTMAELGSFTVNETGRYFFDGIPFGTDHTLRVIPENGVGWNGTESGYVEEVIVFDLLEDREMDVGIRYYEYVPSTSGDIFGMVLYENGPKDGEGAPSAEVVLLNDTGAIIRLTYSNASGYFRFDDIPFGSGYSIEATPRGDDLGETDVSSGYLATTSSQFDHLDGEREMEISLAYYEYLPAEEHPSVTIRDEDGNPVPDVVIIVTIDGIKYTALTDENGVAVFDDLTGTDFPEGASFKAMKNGYEDSEWTEGESVPDMVKEKEDEAGDLLLVIVIIIIIVILVSIVAYLLLRRGAVSGEKYPEE